MPVFANSVVLAGVVDADPKKPSDKAPARFTLKVEESYEKDGETKVRIDAVSVISWGKSAAAVMERVKAGSNVLIEGKVQREAWETDEGTSSRTVISALRIQYLDPRPATPSTADGPLPF